MPGTKKKCVPSYQQNKHLRINTKNRRKATLIEKSFELAKITGCSVFLKNVDHEFEKSVVYGTDDMYLMYSTVGLRPNITERRVKETDIYKEWNDGFNGLVPVPPSPIKGPKKKVNFILPGNLKTIPVFVDREPEYETAEITIPTIQVAEPSDTVRHEEVGPSNSETQIEKTSDTAAGDITNSVVSVCESNDQVACDTSLPLPDLDTSLPALSDSVLESVLEIISDENQTRQYNESECIKSVLSDNSSADQVIVAAPTTGENVNKIHVPDVTNCVDQQVTVEPNTSKCNSDNTAATACINDLNEDSENVSCTFCDVSFFDDRDAGRNKHWINCDGPCKMWMHKTCLPKGFPRPKNNTNNWKCPLCSV